MLTALKRHPDSRGGEALRVETDVVCADLGMVSLRYLVTGAVDEMVLPAPAAPERADELWRHTCFEAFLPAMAGAYYEFNFSPSTRWAAYRFDGYRSGMAEVGGFRTPQIDGRLSPGRYDLRVSLNLNSLPDLPRLGGEDLVLTAVIESVGRETSYWATLHGPGKPDFHAFARLRSSGFEMDFL